MSVVYLNPNQLHVLPSKTTQPIASHSKTKAKVVA